MDEIASKIVSWLKDQRNYKTTFKYVSYFMSPEDKEYALKLLEDFRTAGYISEEYEVEDSFVYYSKASYAALASIVLNEYLDAS